MTRLSKGTKLVNSGRRQRPTLWKIPLFTSAYASLARLKKRSPSRSHGSISMECPPVFHPVVSPRSPLIVSAPPAEIKLSDGTFVSTPLSLSPSASAHSLAWHTPTHTPTHCLSPYQHANKMSAQLGLTLLPHLVASPVLSGFLQGARTFSCNNAKFPHYHLLNIHEYVAGYACHLKSGLLPSNKHTYPSHPLIGFVKRKRQMLVSVELRRVKRETKRKNFEMLNKAG